MKKFSCKSLLSLAGVVVTLTVASSVEAASHVVAEGDSMFSIAEQYGIDPYQLAEANAMEINGLITPGQMLDIRCNPIRKCGTRPINCYKSVRLCCSRRRFFLRDFRSFFIGRLRIVNTKPNDLRDAASILTDFEINRNYLESD